MAAHSRILAWRIPWTEEPGGLQSMWWQSQTRVNRHIQCKNLSDKNMDLLTGSNWDELQ